MSVGKEGRPLIDPKRKHATEKWYWVALRYDGKTMARFVDGAKEREGEVEFAPMGAGKLSLGVRQNRVHGFKGAIREVRVTPAALAEGGLAAGEGVTRGGGGAGRSVARRTGSEEHGLKHRATGGAVSGRGGGSRRGLPARGRATGCRGRRGW